jgi:hypothetical protein
VHAPNLSRINELSSTEPGQLHTSAARLVACVYAVKLRRTIVRLLAFLCFVAPNLSHSDRLRVPCSINSAWLPSNAKGLVGALHETEPGFAKGLVGALHETEPGFPRAGISSLAACTCLRASPPACKSASAARIWRNGRIDLLCRAWLAGC